MRTAFSAWVLALQLATYHGPDVDGRSEGEELAFPRAARSTPLYRVPFGQVTDTAVSVRAGGRHDPPCVLSHRRSSTVNPVDGPFRSQARQQPP